MSYQGTSVILPASGGTGVNNSSNTVTVNTNDFTVACSNQANTLTLANNLTTSGNYALTLTQTAATNVTFPTSGTLQTIAGTLSSIGTWGPTIGDGTNNFTTSTNTGDYVTIYNGTYTLYHFGINLVWSSKGSATAGDAVKISLPTTVNASWHTAPFVIGYVNGITFSTFIMGVGGASGSSFNLYQAVSSSAATEILVSGCASSGQIEISGFFVA